MAKKIPMLFTTGTIIQTTARTSVKIMSTCTQLEYMNTVKIEYISQVVPEKTIDMAAPVDKNILQLET